MENNKVKTAQELSQDITAQEYIVNMKNVMKRSLDELYVIQENANLSFGSNEINCNHMDFIVDKIILVQHIYLGLLEESNNILEEILAIIND